MVVKDMMPNFDLFQPTQIKDALGILDSYGADAWKMAGGYDSLVWFKERIKRPKAVVDLSGIAYRSRSRLYPDRFRRTFDDVKEWGVCSVIRGQNH